MLVNSVIMKFLLCFTLVCFVATATSMNETDKSEESSLLGLKTETDDNLRKELNDQISPPVSNSSESNEKELKTQSNDDLNTTNDDKLR